MPRFRSLTGRAPPSQWPGIIDWSSFSFIYLDSAWKAALQSGVLEHMRDSDVRYCALMYRRLDLLNELVLARGAAIYRASTYTIAQPDASLLSPAQIDDEIALTTSALLAYIVTAESQRTLSAQMHEFKSPPTDAEIRSVTHRSSNPVVDRASQALVDKVLNLEQDFSDAQERK